MNSQVDALLRDRMATGLYASEEEAIQIALTALSQLEPVEQIAPPVVGSREKVLARLAESRRQLDTGEAVEFDDDSLTDLFNSLKQQAGSRAMSG